MTTRTEHLVIPATHPVFAGHFPDRPLVPGALLLDLIVAAWGGPAVRIPTVKFLRPVVPRDELTLEFSPARPGAAVRFLCRRGSETVCSGALLPGASDR